MTDKTPEQEALDVITQENEILEFVWLDDINYHRFNKPFSKKDLRFARCPKGYKVVKIDNDLCLNKWQPIETAPKDGTEVLGYLFEDYSPVPIYYAEGGLSWFCEVTHRYVTPTHWMPLPQPPESEEQ